MKQERSEMEETMRKAQPSEVGGVLSTTIGATEAAERMKRMKFRKESSTIGKEQECLSFEEAISENEWNICFFYLDCDNIW